MVCALLGDSRCLRRESKNGCDESVSSELSPESDDLLNKWPTREGPDSKQAKQVLLHAARILSKEGPLSAESLKEELYESATVEYNTPEAMWEATVRRFYDQIPGFKKFNHGQYDFNNQECRSQFQDHRLVDDFE